MQSVKIQLPNWAKSSWVEARVRLQWVLRSLHRHKNGVASLHAWEKLDSKKKALADILEDAQKKEEGLRSALEMHDLCTIVGCLTEGEAGLDVLQIIAQSGIGYDQVKKLLHILVVEHAVQPLHLSDRVHDMAAKPCSFNKPISGWLQDFSMPACNVSNKGCTGAKVGHGSGVKSLMALARVDDDDKPVVGDALPNFLNKSMPALMTEKLREVHPALHRVDAREWFRAACIRGADTGVF